jgi:hypothetical protein
MQEYNQINYIRHLNAFFATVEQDDRLRSNDISLYMALFHLWNQRGFPQTLEIPRYKVLQLSKIGSRSTYMQCLQSLHNYGYIQYKRPLKKYLFATVSINTFPYKTGPDVKPENRPQVQHEIRPYTGPGISPHVWPGLTTHKAQK